MEETKPEAFTAFSPYDEEKRQGLNNGPLAHTGVGKKAIPAVDTLAMHGSHRGFLLPRGTQVRFASCRFEKWDEAHHSKPFQF